MVGYTNAREVTGPDLTESLNGFGQTLMDGFNGIQFQISELRSECVRMSENPSVGSLVFCAGMEWLVVHRELGEDGGGLLYLAAKDIRGTCAEDIETPIVSFEGNLNANFSGLSAVLQDVSEMPVVTSNDAHYVFIPTLQQVSQQFSLFRNGQYANCAAAWADTGERVPWRLASGVTANGNPSSYVVEASGFYSANIADRAYRNSAESVGFRPFVCMKMR